MSRSRFRDPDITNLIVLFAVRDLRQKPEMIQSRLTKEGGQRLLVEKLVWVYYESNTVYA